jgi:hypothetical protein
MAQSSNNSYPSDICLLLRASGEQHWLTTQVLPVLAQVECPESVPPDQLGAAFAYLEVLWLEAGARAADTDAALEEMLHPQRTGTDASADPGTLCSEGQADERLLRWKALRYHATVRALRRDVDARVRAAIAAPGGLSHQQHATL